MHRTTIELDDRLLRSLKEICHREKKTFKQLVLDLVRFGLEARHKTKKKAASGMAQWVVSKVGLPKNIDPADRSTYQSLIDRNLP